LIALVFLFAYWPLFLVLGLLFLIIVAVTSVVLEQNKRQLQELVELASRRVRNDPCQVQKCYGVIHSISLAGDLATPATSAAMECLREGQGMYRRCMALPWPIYTGTPLETS
jgi:hypothetical protein